MKRIIIAGFAALGLFGDLAAGSIHKCTDAAGNVTFSQTVCPADVSGGEVGYSTPSQQRSSGQASDQSRSLKQKRHIPKSAVRSKPEPSTQPALGGYDPYSIENQVKKYEAEKERRYIKHKRYELDAENRRIRLKNERTADEINSHISRRKQNKIDRAKCDLYKSYARKYEYKDEVRHNRWKLHAAEACR